MTDRGNFIQTFTEGFVKHWWALSFRSVMYYNRNISNNSHSNGTLHLQC